MNMIPTNKVVIGGGVSQIAAVAVWAGAEFGGVVIPVYIAMAGAGLMVSIVQWFVTDKK